jgi:hypothetical protein
MKLRKHSTPKENNEGLKHIDPRTLHTSREYRSLKKGVRTPQNTSTINFN